MNLAHIVKFPQLMAAWRQTLQVKKSIKLPINSSTVKNLDSRSLIHQSTQPSTLCRLSAGRTRETLVCLRK